MKKTLIFFLILCSSCNSNVNEWKSLVRSKTTDQIEKYFKNEMKDLDYI